jgi:signal peptidase I
VSGVVERTAPEAAPERRRPRSRGRRLLSAFGWLAVLVLVLQWPARAWVAEPLVVRTSSMSPTLEPGDRVLTWKLGAGQATWHRGDVVSFRHDGQIWVKRVVALGGDLVGLRDGRLFVNGARVAEPWADPDRVDSVYFGPVRVPAGAVFVMGDDRDSSEDSRSFGPVPETDLTGRVVAVVWPRLAGLAGPEGGVR